MADTREGQRREAELTGAVPLGSAEGDIRKGFVYERVPHVTLKSIAQNPEICEGMTRAEIDAAIARHADTEILFDRPYIDPKVVRVAGPFTVESLSPHRVVADGPEDLVNLPAPIEESGRFVETILDNLRASGVDNRTRGERIRFETLDPYPGRFLQATGTFRERETDRRVAVAIGPQYGTVGPDLVREAAIETGGWFDVLVVCGFAFDALADESTGTAMRLGKLTVLTARMNPDLAMAEELLKKTRTGNLFTVFGQPDIDIRPAAGGAGELQVEIHGLDVYDPTTGVVRSDSTDDIACWFIDTAYDDQQFFVRHAYFLGADDPYDKLKRALRADIDEAAWASLNSTVSRPFPRPASSRIAVKVINHYGDEILKVYGVACARAASSRLCPRPGGCRGRRDGSRGCHLRGSRGPAGTLTASPAQPDRATVSTGRRPYGPAPDIRRMAVHAGTVDAWRYRSRRPSTRSVFRSMPRLTSRVFTDLAIWTMGSAFSSASCSRRSASSWGSPARAS